MMGPRQVKQGALSVLTRSHVPDDHLLRSIGRFVDLSEVRRELAPFYSSMGRSSIDPELTSRILIVVYCFGIRSERRLCEEVHLNLACRCFAVLVCRPWAETNSVDQSGLAAAMRASNRYAHERAIAGRRSRIALVYNRGRYPSGVRRGS
jgi:hypothetical protein